MNTSLVNFVNFVNLHEGYCICFARWAKNAGKRAKQMGFWGVKFTKFTSSQGFFCPKKGGAGGKRAENGHFSTQNCEYFEHLLTTWKVGRDFVLHGGARAGAGGSNSVNFVNFPFLKFTECSHRSGGRA